MSNAIGNSSIFSCNGKETVIKCNVKTEYGKQQVPVDFLLTGKRETGANPVRSRHCKYGVHKHRIMRGWSLG